MTKTSLIATAFFLAGLCAAQAGSTDWLQGKLAAVSSIKLSDTEIGSGLKEALRVGIQNTVKLLGRQDGYLGNPEVKILLPQSIQKMDAALRKLGFGQQVDEFTVSMNRAAEKAAPLAADIFAAAITDISFDDAKKILDGNNTAATDYLKKATYAKLKDAFKPAVVDSMNQYAVTQKYQEISGKIKTLPLLGNLAATVDINDYVCSKALDGVFTVLGKQEADIRANPSARATDLLKKVFNK